MAPFGLGGERELAVVRTPHIGGVVEFYRLIDRQLRTNLSAVQVAGDRLAVGAGRHDRVLRVWLPD